MTFRMLDSPAEIEGYASAVAQLAGIPQQHVEKDFWITEALRGVANASRETGCSVIFKGGTSLSKAYRLIERFSEDVDLLTILPEGSPKARNRILKNIVAGAESATGIEGELDLASVTKGVKRSVRLNYHLALEPAGLRSSVLIEIGTRGGALPFVRRPVQSLIAEYAERAGLDADFEEIEPVSLLVLEPARTLVEKLMILHHAATEGDSKRRRDTARHYYDVDMLLRSKAVLDELKLQNADVLAREVAQHSTAAGLPSAERPQDGFAVSPAWAADQPDVEQSYDDVLRLLVWPNAETSTFAECCQRVHELDDVL